MGRRAAALSLLACVLFLTSLPGLARLVSGARGLVSAPHLDLGAGLLNAAHPSSVDPSWRMPLGPLAETVLAARAPAAALPAAMACALAATAFLTAALGAVLAGSAAGAAAAGLALAVLVRLPASPGFLKMAFYTPLALLAAGALVLRARRPGPRADLAAGVAVGAGLLYRSTLAFLLPLVVVLEFVLVHRCSARRAWKSAALLLLPSVLLLLPWARMNANLHGYWTPFERGASDMLVVGGALGLVDTTAEGDVRRLDPSLDNDRPGTASLWAARRVLAQPIPFLKAVAARLAYVAGLRPWLLALALFGFWRARRDEAARTLGLVVLYFIGLHCLLSTLEYYYEPLWPLLATACAAAAWAGRREPPLWASGSVAAGVLGALVCAAAAEAAILRYTALAPATSIEALARALAAAPDDPFLLLESARVSIGRGQAQRAKEALERAELRLPGLPRLAVESARARQRLGEHGALWRGLPEAPPYAFDDDVSVRLGLYRALEAAREGDLALARRALARARAAWSAQQRMTVARDASEREMEARLKRDSDESLAMAAAGVFDREEVRDWAALLASVAAQDSPELARGLALMLQDAGDPASACAVLEDLVRRRPRDARLWSDLGAASFRAGRRARAAQALRRAVSLAPDSSEIARSLEAAIKELP
jgi:4-amino-4-deoxy-L-arabinose transferase-like glycosyltransferase